MLKVPRFVWIFVFALAFFAVGNDRAEADTALASWYGSGLQGPPTASGEPDDPWCYTAARKTLPPGTELVASYGGRSVQVRVNDRGPCVGGRDLDLSQGAATGIGLTSAGVGYVDYYVAGGSGYDRAYSELDYPADAGYPDPGYGGYSGGGERADAGRYRGCRGRGVRGAAGGYPGGGRPAARDHGRGHRRRERGIADPNVLYVGQTLYY